MLERRQALVKEGFRKLTQKDHKEALNCFDQAIAIQSHPDAYRGRGLVLTEQGRNNEAIAELDKAIALFKNNNPALAELHKRKGICYINKGELKKALVEFTNARQLSAVPRTAEHESYCLDQALIYVMNGQFEQAVEPIEYVLKGPLSWPEKKNSAHLTRVELYIQSAYLTGNNAKLDLALQEMNHLTSPDTHDLLRGRIYKLQGKHEDAIECFRTVLANRKTVSAFVVARAAIELFFLGVTVDFSDIINESLKVRSARADETCTLALCYFAQGDLIIAKAYCEEALKNTAIIPVTQYLRDQFYTMFFSLYFDPMKKILRLPEMHHLKSHFDALYKFLSINQVEELHIVNNSLGDDESKILSTFTKIHSLDISKNHVTPDERKRLSTLSHLRELRAHSQTSPPGYFPTGIDAKLEHYSWLLGHSKIQECLEACEQAIREFPWNAEFYKTRAESILRLCGARAIDASILDLNIVLELNPTNIMVYLRRASLYLEKNDSKHAEADYEKVLLSTSNLAIITYCKLALMKLRKSNSEAERTNIAAHLARLPTHQVEQGFVTILAYFQLGDTARVIQSLKTFFECAHIGELPKTFRKEFLEILLKIDVNNSEKLALKVTENCIAKLLFYINEVIDTDLKINLLVKALDPKTFIGAIFHKNISLFAKSPIPDIEASLSEVVVNENLSLQACKALIDSKDLKIKDKVERQIIKNINAAVIARDEINLAGWCYVLDQANPGAGKKWHDYYVKVSSVKAPVPQDAPPPYSSVANSSAALFASTGLPAPSAPPVEDLGELLYRQLGYS